MFVAEMSPNHLRSLFAGLLLLLAAAAPAQQYHTHIYGKQDGLISGSIYDVEQDESGRIWLATRHGLTSYDGINWSSFDNFQYKTVGGPRFLEIDDEGRLWSLSILPPLSLSCHEPSGDRLWRMRLPLSYTLREPSAMALCDRDDGTPCVAVSTLGCEVALWDGSEWRVSDLSDSVAWISRLVWVEGVLHICTDQGLWRREPDDDPVRVRMPGLPDGPVASMAPSRTGGFWIVGEGWIGRSRDGRVEVLASDLGFFIGESCFGASILEGPCGGLYFGDTGQLHYFDPQRGSIEKLDRSNGLVTSGVTDLELDHEGTVWVSSYRGLTAVLGRDFSAYDRSHGLLEDEVSAILERKDGSIVLGHAGGLTFLGDPPRTLSYGERNPFLRVVDLCESPDGELWLAADQAGLGRWTPEGGYDWFTVHGMFETEFYAVLFLPDGTLVTGTKHGVYRREGDALVPVPLLDDPSPMKPYVRRLQLDRSGALLVSTGNKGFFRLDDDGVEVFLPRDDDNPLAAKTYCAYEDPGGRLWIGTNAGLREAVEGELRIPSAPDPVIDLPVYAILEDAQGRLWFGTEQGVRRWNGKTVTAFDMANGLVGNEVNRDALKLDSLGRIWIGTEGGVTRYDPRFDPPSLPPLRVDLVAVEVNGVRRPLGEVLDGSLDLGLGPCDLVFHYAGLSFRNRLRLRFRTRLEGAEADWSAPHVSPQALERYLNVPHGTYRFHLQAVSADGRLGESVVSVPLVVRPQLWQVGWVRGLGALLGLLMVWILVYALLSSGYTRRLRREVETRTRELAESEALLRRESIRLAAVLEHISDGVMTLDETHVVTLCNPGAVRILGRPAEKIIDAALADLLPVVEDWLSDGSIEEPRISPETLVRTPDRRDLWLELAVTPMSGPEPDVAGMVLVLRDVTRRHLMLHEQMRAQRLESLGVLAGGIAHDFNNLLMAIVGNASLMMETEALDAAGRESLRGVLTAGERARQLTGNLLTIARGGDPQRRSLGVEKIAHEAVELAMSGSNVVTEMDMGPDLPNVLADPTQLGQVFSNLLINARQAMPDGGRVRIVARRLEGGREGLQGNLFVRLRIEDEGTGISPDVIDHVFEPYFTTKDTGSGLGLAIVYSVVQRHGGAITVTSPRSGGTVVEIILPATSLDDATPSPEREADPPPLERVLLMDDEAGVREIIRRHLIGCGVAVISAPRGEEAVSLFRHEVEAGRGFDAVILDLTVRGGLGGLETFRQMRELDPHVVGVVTSGYAEDPIMVDPAAHGFATALVKPFEREDLMAALERAVG